MVTYGSELTLLDYRLVKYIHVGRLDVLSSVLLESS